MSWLKTDETKQPNAIVVAPHTRGKVVLITGATGGLGHGLAAALQARYVHLDVLINNIGALPVICLASASEFDGVSGKYFKKHVGPCASSAASDDQAAGERLWRVSAALTGSIAEGA